MISRFELLFVWWVEPENGWKTSLVCVALLISLNQVWYEFIHLNELTNFGVGRGVENYENSQFRKLSIILHFK